MTILLNHCYTSQLKYINIDLQINSDWNYISICYSTIILEWQCFLQKLTIIIKITMKYKKNRHIYIYLLRKLFYMHDICYSCYYKSRAAVPDSVCIIHILDQMKIECQLLRISLLFHYSVSLALFLFFRYLLFQVMWIHYYLVIYVI